MTGSKDPGAIGESNGEQSDAEAEGGMTRRAAMGALGLSGLGLLGSQPGPSGGRGRLPWYNWQTDVDANGNRLEALGGLEMQSTGQTITDFAGENLNVSQGTLNADVPEVPEIPEIPPGPAVDYVDIDDYGADPTGEEPSDEALDAAIEDLSDGDTLVMTNGEYWFDAPHEIYNDYVTVLGTGSQLRITGIEYGAYSHFLSFGDFTSVNDFDGDTVIAEDVSEGQQVIEVEDPSPFSEGDDITVSETKYDNTPTLSWGGTAGRGTAPTRAVIREIDGSQLHLDRGLNYDHGAGNAGVFLLDSVVGGRFVDMHMVEGDGEEESEGFLMTAYARDCQYINCTAEQYVGFPFTDIHSLRTEMFDCEAKNPVLPEGRASSHWEPFQFRGSTDPLVVRPSIDTCRRGIDINAGSKVVRVFDPEIRNAYLHGMCFHSNGTQQVYGAYEVYGGRVEAASEVLHDKYHFGAGLSMSPNMSHVKVFGTTVVGRSRAIHTPYGQAPNLTLEGCTLETFASDLPDSINVSESYVINGQLRASRLENVDVVSRGGNDSRAINLNGAEDVHVSAQVTGSPVDDVVYVGNATDVTLDVDVLDNENPDAPDVTIEDSQNTKVEGNLQGLGRSVAMRGSIFDARVTDVDAEGNAPPIGYAGGDGTVSNVWVTGCNTVGGENADIDFETELEDEISGLWIKNNVCGEIRYNGSAADDDTFVSDNLTGQESGGGGGGNGMEGDGTEENPYVVENAGHLQQIDDEPDAHYVLGSDVDASETAEWNAGQGFQPIGTFTGSLDGNGHAIGGLTIDRPTETWIGMIAEVGAGGLIENLTLTNVDVNGSDHTGGLAGIVRDAEIRNVSLSGSVSGSRRTGGIAGLQQGLVEDVDVDVDVTSDNALTAAIAGDLEGTVRNSTAAGSVTADHESGGVSGWDNGGVIEGCHADVTVEGATHSIGGLTGVVINGGSVSGSSAAGDVSGAEFVGGFVGAIYPSASGVDTSTASGSVSGETAVGGFAGSNAQEVDNCYAEGSAHASNDQAGGFAGVNDDGAVLTASYAVGSVSGSGDVGGLAGANNGTIESAYWDTEATGQSASVGSGTEAGTGLTTAEMTGDAAAENMSALDFGSTWTTTNSYPQLAWE